MKLAIDFILITGLVLNIFVLLGLIKLKSKALPQKILIVFWSFILLTIIHFYAKLHDLELLNIVTYFFQNGARLLLAPLIYIYIKSIFLTDRNFIKKQLFHFLPFVIYLLFYIIPVIVNYFIEPTIFSYIPYVDLYFNQGLVQDTYSVGYMYLSLKLFYRVNETLKHQYSFMSEKDFTWIKKFLWSFLMVVLVDLILVICKVIFGYIANWDGFITIVFLIVAMVYLGYYGLTQSTIFLPDFLIIENKIKINPTVKTQEELQGLKLKLELLMKEDKPYLFPELTLRHLSEKVDISERKLSMLLNEEMHTSFYDFINKYRIKEAKDKLNSTTFDKYSITGIGFNCGFNSKSSFYRIFKNETGMSPSVYKKSTIN
jgi:AraC-like DNA-binding protein